jgi:hypothetical protein
MSCRNYDPCLDSKLNQIGSYAAAARSSAQNSAASAEQSENFSQASATSASQSATSANNAATSATNSQNSATDSADSASEANNYLTQVTNIFEDFDERYLGAKSVAPTVDNQGNPLQEGALYWNSVSDQMFAWNGTIWVATNFNQLTPFTATGTPTARNLVTRASDVVNVKDFGAVGNGVADDRLAFQNAMATGKSVYIPDGTYNLTTGVVISDYNATLVLIGSSKDKVKLISNVGTWMFFLGNTKGVQFENITFDGRRVREINGWPWFNPQLYDGTFRIIQAECPQGLDNSFISIDKCEFLNTASLPIFFYYFNNVKITNSRFYKTGDPGLVFCNNVIWSNNITEYSLDNGVSMSRGNQNVVVESSIFKDCKANGVWVSGFIIPGTGTVTATGASFNVLDQVTLTSTSPWQNIFDGAYITQYSGSLEATYKIISVTSASVAIGVCVNSINPAFQGVPISNWDYSPSYGPNNFIVSNNIIIGGYYSGVYAHQSNNNGQISNNVILRSGWQADSEIKTIGSIAVGSTTLYVNSSSNFSIGDYIIVNPINSYRNYFITKITNIVGNIITTATPPTITYISENIQLLHTESTISSGRNHIVISGSNSGFPDAVSNQISISNNIMSDSSGECILLVGEGDGGSVKNIKINNNSMYFNSNAAGLFPLNLRHGVFINEANPLDQPCENIIVTDNFYTGYGSIVNYRQNSLAIRDYIVCANNTYPNGFDFFARDIATSTVLTDNYRTSHYDQYGTLTADAITTKTLQFPAWGVGTVVAGVMNVMQSTISFAGTNPTTQITDFTKGVNSDLVMFSLRNSNISVGDTITIVHDFGKIRTQTGANIVLGPGQTALFAFLNSTIVAQIG